MLRPRAPDSKAAPILQTDGHTDGKWSHLETPLCLKTLIATKVPQGGIQTHQLRLTAEVAHQ